MKTLEKIFDEIESDYEWQRTYPIDLCVEAMREAVKQALELAAERAEIRRHNHNGEMISKTVWIDDTYAMTVEVHKPSILSIIDEIK